MTTSPPGPHENGRPTNGRSTYRTFAEHQRVFDQIWTQYPNRQNRTSSSWWFFVLFPEGEEGYGPRQLMFTIAAGAGKGIRVNDIPLPRMDRNRSVENGIDRFDAISLGWYGDDQQVYDRLVNQPAEATLSREGSLVAWAHHDDGPKRGGEIRASADRPLGLDAHFVGANGEARFEAWGKLDSPNTSPIVAMDIDTIVGGAHLVPWRRMQFSGEFDLPGGRERLEGLCYFHRACLNVPLFPWKWIWAVFPDGAAFSVFVPYLGPQLLRKGYRFFSSETLERATIPLRQSGMWDWGTTAPSIEFDSARITPVVDSGDHPDFAVRAANDRGDSVAFTARSYGHARNYLDRPILRGLLESHWSYNEYLFRIEELRGSIGGRPLDAAAMGQAYGTLEYAWGVSL